MTSRWGEWGVTNMLEGRAAIQRDPDRLEKQADRNLPRFNRTTVLCMGREGRLCCTGWHCLARNKLC